MYASLLSALLLGLVPLGHVPATENSVLRNIHVAAPSVPLEIPGHLSASGILVMDLESGEPIFMYNSDARRPIASITKLMTALIIAENHDLEELVTIPATVNEIPGTVAGLPAGQNFSVGDLLTAMLVGSANDAATVLARFHSGSTSAFVIEMNKRLEMLGLTDTRFANPSGLDSPDQWSTPHDVAWITTFVLRNPIIASRMHMRTAYIQSVEGQGISLTHTHALIHTELEVAAGKTGTTPQAKECLVTVVDINGHEYVVVLLRSLQRYKDMRTILTALTEASPSTLSKREPATEYGG